MAEVRQLLGLLGEWNRSATTQDRERVWHKMLAIHADQVFTIGTVNGTRQPVVVASNLANVPEEAVYNFEPGGYFGRYLPDTFWFRDLTQ